MRPSIQRSVLSENATAIYRSGIAIDRATENNIVIIKRRSGSSAEGEEEEKKEEAQHSGRDYFS